MISNQILLVKGSKWFVCRWKIDTSLIFLTSTRNFLTLISLSLASLWIGLAKQLSSWCNHRSHSPQKGTINLGLKPDLTKFHSKWLFGCLPNCAKVITIAINSDTNETLCYLIAKICNCNCNYLRIYNCEKKYITLFLSTLQKVIVLLINRKFLRPVDKKN